MTVYFQWTEDFLLFPIDFFHQASANGNDFSFNQDETEKYSYRRYLT